MHPKTAERLVKEALTVGYRALKERRDAKQSAKAHADVSTKGDKIVGAAIINYLRKEAPTGVIYTEERGQVTTNNSAEYSAILDDIDGTLNFKEGNGMMPHGSILGIFNGANPRFKDCIAAGFLEFNSGNLYYAVKGVGAFLVEDFVGNGKRHDSIRTSGREKMKDTTPLKIGVDLYSFGDTVSRIMPFPIKEYWPVDVRCRAAHMAMVSYGGLDAFIGSNNFANPLKRSTAEDLAPGYLIVSEAGGVMVDWEGNDLGPQKVGMAEGKEYQVVIASTKKLASALLKRI
ncbi:MAG: hypothetical protein KGH61_01780 [Candidatus Micrarchaeota archaeon]|nr:hypothetical protein [Candidatus Micrarchaeota archaeon]MDE1847660.1 hypothetical protein [Candidatus Micrarchaeota archaeon]MDE1864481.1 hypothetical protein [Candidatus Micrarchaeota archaeon]